jgi:hypothetical protein
MMPKNAITARRASFTLISLRFATRRCLPPAINWPDPSSHATPASPPGSCLLPIPALECQSAGRRIYSQYMAIRSLSFDDSSEEDLFVFSGHDLMLAYDDHMDLDWQEVAERTEIDERRGLVVLQVTALEDLVDEFILYGTDPPGPEALRRTLCRQTLGPRIDRLEGILWRAGLLDDEATELIADLRRVTERRNELAHGTIHLRPVGGILPRLNEHDFDVEWVIWNRRWQRVRRLTMSQLRDDLYDAMGTFTSLLRYGSKLAAAAPRPVNFTEGHYLCPPCPEDCGHEHTES